MPPKKSPTREHPPNVAPGAALGEPLEVPELVVYNDLGHAKPIGQLTVSQLRDSLPYASKVDRPTLQKVLAMALEAGQPDTCLLGSVLRFNIREVIVVDGYLAGPKSARGPRP